VTDQVPHPNKTQGNITDLHILIFKFSERRREDRRFWCKW